MFAQVHLVVVADDAACSVRKFLLQHEVWLDVDTLSDRCKLDFRASRRVALQLDWLVIHGDRNHMLLALFAVMLLMSEFDLILFHGLFSLPIRILIAIMQSARLV